MLYFKADLDSPYYPILKEKEIKYRKHLQGLQCKYCNDEVIHVIISYPIVKIVPCCENFGQYIQSRIEQVEAST